MTGTSPPVRPGRRPRPRTGVRGLSTPRGAALPNQLGYGPPGATEHRAAVARGLMCFGLGLPFGVVFGVVDTVALDSGRSPHVWYQVAAVALGAGLLVAAVLARAAANLGTSLGTPLALLGVVSAGAWIVLFNTGDPVAVEALVAIGLGASVPPLLLVGIEARGLRPRARPLGEVGRPAAAALTGAAVGATVMFLDPTIVWSDVTVVGGVLAAWGALRRATLPDRALGPIDTAEIAPPPDLTPLGVRVLLAVALGAAAAPAIRVGPFLAEGWDAGVRYLLLTLAVAGSAGAASLIGLMWLPRRTRAATDEVARVGILVAASLLLVAISETLPGTVVGTGVAAGWAVAGITWLAAADDAEHAAPMRTAMPALSGFAAWVVVWVTWPTLSDAVADAGGSERWVFALAALPALVVGAAVATRPADATAPDKGPDAQSDTHPDGLRLAPAPSINGHHDDAPLLSARGVEFSYGAVQVLFGVDLEVRAGEVVALLGTNGVGKTTFLRTVAGLGRPSAGEIRLGDVDLEGCSPSDRVVLGIHQIASGAAVAPDLTVAANLAMYGHTLRPAEARAGARRAVDVFPRLGERLGQRASALSGGERQMLAMSKSLVLRPRLLVIDEVTLGLAPVAVAALVPVIRRLHDDGCSVLLAEQSVQLALDLADRAVCMEKGRIVFESDAASLRADPTLLEAVYLEGVTAALEHHGAGT